jgi:3-hydroxyacyl-[acyl-carrier-protein] dehydratase
MNADFHREPLSIGADHPSLPGHFPGRPVVPGVVLLDRVAAAFERWHGAGVGALPQAKFLQPLLPDQCAEIELRRDGRRVAWRIVRDGVDIAVGSIEGAGA